MPCNSPKASLQLDLLHQETQNLKDEIQWERTKHDKTYERITTLLRNKNIPIHDHDHDHKGPRQLQHALETKIKHYTKIQKLLSLQVEYTESALASTLHEDEDEDQEQEQQDLDTLLTTLKQDLADADEQLQALRN